jgi:probable phosphoglycerate mutase
MGDSEEQITKPDESASWRRFNALDKCSALGNRYLVLRHGQSEANTSKIIASEPGLCGPLTRLTATGREEVRETSRELLKSGIVPTVLSSDFLRARESAQILSEILGGGEVQLRTELRERYFGELDGGPDSAYSKIWSLDAGDPFHREYGVESAIEVLGRTSNLIADLEDCYRDMTFVLVSHGDTLQILQCAFGRISPGLHRSVPYLKTAAIRELVLAP